MPITLPTNIDKRSFADRLMRVTAAAPFTAFRWKRGEIYAAEVVGCIQLGQTRINILPKLDTLEPDRDKSFLMNLLRSAGYLKQLHHGAADVRTESSDPLETLISELSSEILRALQKGNPRRYEEIFEDSSVVRGRIDFTRLSTRPPGVASVPIRYSPLGSNNRLSRVIKGIAKILHRITLNSANRQRLSLILSSFLPTSNKPVSVAEVDAIVLSRHEMHWSRSLSIGRLILSGLSPDPTFSGNNEAFSLLFPMQHLYERALRKILSRAMEDSEINVSSRDDGIFLFTDNESEAGIVRLRPDYLFKKDGKTIAIADAKWKRAAERGTSHGVKRNDFYQIYAYLTRYKVKNSLILIPRAPWMSERWLKSYRDTESTAQIYLIGIDAEGLFSNNLETRDKSLKILSETISSIVI